MSELWSRINQFTDFSISRSSVETLIYHGIGLLAAERLHVTGQPVPPLLQSERETATMVHLAGRALMQRIRDTIDGPMLLIKGPEIAAAYPHPNLRSYGDLDILVADSGKAKSALLARGFEEVNDYQFAHTQRPLRWPGCPVLIELHHMLPWLTWMNTPPIDVYFERATPSGTATDGVTTLPKVDHTLLIAAHSWRHSPLRRVGDLIDIAVMAEDLESSELAARAGQLNMAGVWSTTTRATEAVLAQDSSLSFPLRTWARHLLPPGERSVMQIHTAVWLGALWAPTLMDKRKALVQAWTNEFQPMPGEPWIDKFGRIRRAVSEANAPALHRSRKAPDPT
jgi:hypothetical protein